MKRWMKIDWLSFSFTVRGRDNEPLNERDVMAGLAERCSSAPELHAAVMDRSVSDLSYGRAPYTVRIVLDSGLGDIFFNPVLTHALFEISGSAWDRWESAGFGIDLLSVAAETVTRIDIAQDIECDTLPSAFVAEMTGGARMQQSVIRSTSGETCYIGSPKSEMYTRVYRYAEPHPRAGLLRVENVVRKKYARKLIPALLSGNLEQVSGALNARYGWSKELWGDGEIGSIGLDSVRPEGGGKSTVSWLIRQAAPAFRRLVDDGTIADPEAFIRKYFGVQ